MGRGGHRQPDVAGRVLDDLRVLARDDVQERLARRRGDEVVVLAEDLEDRHVDVLDVDVLAVQVQLVVVQFVVLVDLLQELGVGVAGHVDAVAEPLLHPGEVRDEVVALEVLEEGDVLADVVVDRVHQREAVVEHVRGRVAEGVGDVLRVVVLLGTPVLEDAAGVVEVQPRGHEPEGVDLLGVEGRVHGALSAAHAVSENVDGVLARALADLVDAVVHVAVDVVVEREVLVEPRGLAPVDHVDVVAGVEQLADHAAIGLQVEDVRPVDQRVDDEDRDLVLLVGAGLVVEQFELVLRVDDLRGGLAHLDGGHLRAALGQVAGPAGRVGHRLEGLGARVDGGGEWIEGHGITPRRRRGSGRVCSRRPAGGARVRPVGRRSRRRRRGSGAPSG